MFFKVFGNYWVCFKVVFFFILDESFKSFENYIVKLLVKEIKWNLLEVRIYFIFFEIFILKCDFGFVMLLGFWRNGFLIGDIMLCFFLLGVCMGIRKFNVGGN